ncbi:MAG TPA: tRNA lysidine(34) synthetase TilS [Phenylobacterium sp.]|nr:tRNA lysidine(34) synthetase TilS [Phenylobacterium sp.]HEX2558584.1 tRNA lysidine(34) synthetase TilS [Phenylobacterium sp.]
MRRLGREATTAAGDPADIEARAWPALGRRLRADTRTPIAVAFSGGGDSLALLLSAHTWALANGRRLIALHVDHGLQPEGPAWAARCAETAARLGVAFQALAWRGEKPARGLPAAARLARHRLLAEAAREAGARVILLGHTADDLSETLAMRAEGSTTPLAREWGPSPVWPEGRDVFLLRPLLAVGRAEIRGWLAARGETWIEDPANLDLRFARARARAAGAHAEAVPPEPPPEGAAALARAVVLETGDVMRISRRALRETSAATAFLSAACLCAGGGERPPRRERVEALAARLLGEAALTATLAGARIEAAGESAWFMREAGEAGRGGLPETPLPPGDTVVWDGRYEMLARCSAQVRPLAGAAKRLNTEQQRAMLAVRAGARSALPLVVRDHEAACPVLADDGTQARFLGLERLLAACGAVEREPS